jgi:hypothetical protein
MIASHCICSEYVSQPVMTSAIQKILDLRHRVFVNSLDLHPVLVKCELAFRDIDETCSWNEIVLPSLRQAVHVHRATERLRQPPSYPIIDCAELCVLMELQRTLLLRCCIAPATRFTF